MAGSWEIFCKEMCVTDVGRNGIPQPLEPLRGVYISCQMKDEGIGEGSFVNILATSLSKDVFLWENAKIVKVDGPVVVFLADKERDGVEPVSEVIELLLDRIILIQHHIKN